jgi:hypothetical protein
LGQGLGPWLSPPNSLSTTSPLSSFRKILSVGTAIAGR